jgi:two-component system, response regulator PdtaR
LQITLLIVEDEHLILEFVCAEMSDAGLPTLGATTADEAIRILRSTPEISAIVTDINMPGSMNGLQLADIVHRHWPSIQIIITSGRRTPAKFEMPLGAEFVPKPFFPRQILEAVGQ